MDSIVTGYNKEKNKFRVVLNNGDRKLFPRIYVYFCIEDPK
jgi:hypothetical protein